MSLGDVVQQLVGTLQYPTAFCTAAGASNLLMSERQDTCAFGEGFLNHVPGAVAAAPLYVYAVHRISQTQRPRLYVNLFQTGMGVGFYLLHLYLGTESPFVTVAPGTMMGYLLVNGNLEVPDDA